MQWRWGLYLAVGAALLTYTVLGFVASKTTMIPFTLGPGAVAEVSVLRLNPGVLRMNAWFKGRGRKELGGVDFSALKEGRSGNYPLDGVAHLEVEVRPSWQEPVRYSAQPAGGFTSEHTARFLSSVSPDDKLPNPKVVFRKGMNELSLVVTSVDQVLVGETIEIWIDPALGFKSSEPKVSWLFWSIIWPLYTIPYLLWGAVLLWLHRKKQGTRAILPR